ncbi:MAG TPA: HTTM domain-containing protein, partial [Polyangiaceae bacterium]
FLPLNRRFSVDAVLASLRGDRSVSLARLNAPLARDTRPVVSLAVTALILQWAVIYYFNVVHKTGSQWRDGTAVYYFFQQDRMVTWLGAWLRDFLPLVAYKAMTFGALAIEGSVALLLVLPFKPSYTRMIAWALVCTLHLSIDAVVQLGPFSWAMVVMFFALIPRELWERLAPAFKKRRPAQDFVVASDNALSLAMARVIKRFDTFNQVAFVAGVGSEQEPAAPCSAIDRSSGQRYQGALALRRVAEALPLGSLPVVWLALPPFAGVADRWLQRAAADTGKLAAYCGVKSHSLDPLEKEPSPARRFFARVAWVAGECGVLFLMVCCASQVLIENAAVPPQLKLKSRPEWMTAVIVYPRLFQGWSMFAPSPPTDDGRLVIDGRTKDGRHFDPLTGQVPSFDVQPKGGYRMNQIWGDFHRRVAEERFRVYWPGVRDFIKNHHLITGRPEDELEAFDVWFVSEQIPPPGEPKTPPTRRKLMSYGVVKD